MNKELIGNLPEYYKKQIAVSLECNPSFNRMWGHQNATGRYNEAIENYFSWRSSEKGHDYWILIKDMILNHEQHNNL